jgi:hypothetical protein
MFHQPGELDHLEIVPACFHPQLTELFSATNNHQRNAAAKVAPSIQKRINPPLRRKPAREHSVLSNSSPGLRVRRDEIRFDKYLFCRQSTLQKFTPGKLRGDDVALHLPVPGMESAMHNQHHAYGCSFCARVAIASVPDASPQRMFHALFTDFAIPEKDSYGT